MTSLTLFIQCTRVQSPSPAVSNVWDCWNVRNAKPTSTVKQSGVYKAGACTTTDILPRPASCYTGTVLHAKEKFLEGHQMACSKNVVCTLLHCSPSPSPRQLLSKKKYPVRLE